jgi:hypothetical protein
MDACGNQKSCQQTIACVPFSQAIVTDSSLCSFDENPATPCRDFRLLYTPYGSAYKLNASNPGQTYYNIFYKYPGTLPVPPNTPVTFTITLPYPYVTQGANPVHAYSDVNITGTYPNVCLTPLNPLPITSVSPTAVTLGTYLANPVVVTTTTTVTVKMTVPSGGFIYLNIHLDYGLKGTVGLGKGGPSGNDAINPTTQAVLIPDAKNYPFSVTWDNGANTYTDGICNINVFKKNPGVGGRAVSQYTTSDGVSGAIGVINAGATLTDTSGHVLATGSTDSDGWYMLTYKYTGKATTLNVILTPPGKAKQTQTIIIKSNAFVEADYTVP